jgi:predicted flap endonuclease-1-like 5' DNA nuclease
MDTYTMLIIIIEVGVLILLGYVVYNSPRRVEKPKQATPPEPKTGAAEEPETEPAPKPEPSLPEEPAAESVKLAEPSPESAPVEAPAETTQAKAAEAKPKKTPTAAEKKERGFKIVDIEGIGKTYTKKLNAAGIHTTDELLREGATPRGRKQLSEKTGIPHEQILEWVNLSDLFRIKGIGEEYSDLLEEAGVDTVVELAHRNAEHLHAKILEVNEAKKLVRRPPPLSSVEAWIEDAKSLPRVIEY